MQLFIIIFFYQSNYNIAHIVQMQHLKNTIAFIRFLQLAVTCKNITACAQPLSLTVDFL